MPHLLTAKTAAAIKRRLWDGETCESLAPSFDVSVSTVRMILLGKRWGEIAWPEKDPATGAVLAGKMPKWRHDLIFKARRDVAKDMHRAVKKRLAEGVED